MRAPPHGRPRALLSASLILALGLTGCSSAPYIYQTYLGTSGRITRVECNEAYEVFEKPQARLLMVRSSPGVEAIRAVCGQEPALARYRKAAQQHLAETDRPNCTVSDRITELTPLHVEFSYTCGPLAPLPSATPAASRPR